mgnify:CR=1 FL=1
MTPEQIAHKVAGDWIMGPIDMGDLEHRIANAIRVEHARIDLAYVALQQIQRMAEDAMNTPTPEGHSYATVDHILHMARKALLTLQGEV